MDEAVSAYELHFYGNPAEVLRVHAEQGNADAQFILGQLYVQGTQGLGVVFGAILGVPEDALVRTRHYRMCKR